MQLLTLLLDGQAQGAGGMDSLIMIVAIIAIFYFFMIRPQQKRQKKIRMEREAMKKGDSVITAGGIYGRIREVADTYFLVEIDKDIKVKVDKNMIYSAADPTAATDAAEQLKQK